MFTSKCKINRCSTDTSEKQAQNDIKDVPKATKRCIILMVVLIAMIKFLLISLAAVMLTVISYNASNSKMVDLKTQGCDTTENYRD